MSRDMLLGPNVATQEVQGVSIFGPEAAHFDRFFTAFLDRFWPMPRDGTSIHALVMFYRSYFNQIAFRFIVIKLYLYY